jgi:hypothetical protein
MNHGENTRVEIQKRQSVEKLTTSKTRDRIKKLRCNVYKRFHLLILWNFCGDNICTKHIFKQISVFLVD